MKKFTVIIASLLFFAGATFAQQTATPAQGKQTTKSTTPAPAASGSTGVKKVPASKGTPTKPVQTVKTPAAGTTGK